MVLSLYFNLPLVGAFPRIELLIFLGVSVGLSFGLIPVDFQKVISVLEIVAQGAQTVLGLIVSVDLVIYLEVLLNII